ncbi:hypothetical protein [Yersinia enterocolitica]|uniref:hypothetical protein n=1 Tax=Yersinia enterocolitica TaxID=630 RepID=UPI0033033827|nr:hypothetical protein [Yersinia enterocolitica]HDL7465125.1 hypothetical protein [Yersinia enterocolitica]
MIEEWFVIPIVEEQKLRGWLTSRSGYRFQQTGIDKDLYINSIDNIHNVKKGDISCQLEKEYDAQQGNLLVSFIFKEGTLDERLLGLMRYEFTVSDSSCY